MISWSPPISIHLINNGLGSSNRLKLWSSLDSIGIALSSAEYTRARFSGLDDIDHFSLPPISRPRPEVPKSQPPGGRPSDLPYVDSTYSFAEPDISLLYKICHKPLQRRRLQLLQPHIYRRRPALAARATHTPQDYTAYPSGVVLCSAQYTATTVPFWCSIDEANRLAIPKRTVHLHHRTPPDLRRGYGSSGLYPLSFHLPSTCAVCAPVFAVDILKPSAVSLDCCACAVHMAAASLRRLSLLARLRRRYVASQCRLFSFSRLHRRRPGDRARPSLRWVPVATLPGLCVSFAVVGSRRHSSAPDVEVGSVVSREYLHIASTFFRVRHMAVAAFLERSTSSCAVDMAAAAFTLQCRQHLPSTCAVCAVHMAAATFLDDPVFTVDLLTSPSAP
ncbi:hypothetical protein B0H16DRAFT_1742973 [Mycena metata]|uniref:Uncharacterized protein n=1 Tax=Mycena metata TaxID=1033252 RepID=A0AAD7H7B6_9AGAR|nr:hypothetical protein B0H16DRAFT_1742973 [Mycena metata]